jgi:hypothetical protein
MGEQRTCEVLKHADRGAWMSDVNAIDERRSPQGLQLGSMLHAWLHVRVAHRATG